MKNTNIVRLGVVRDLLAELDRLRAHVLSGGVTGFCASLIGSSGRETVYLGGVYKEDPSAALKATMKVSMARTLNEDEEDEDRPPMFANSRF